MQDSGAPDSSSPAADNSESCSAGSVLRTSIHGSIDTTIDWGSADMDCDSMLRPDGEGARLRFSGEVLEQRLAIIIALPTLERGISKIEIPSNVTAIVEGSGRFFSTPDLNSCWTEVGSHDVVDSDNEIYRIKGALFCVSPLGEINGDAAISIAELSFSTTVQWSSQ